MRVMRLVHGWFLVRVGSYQVHVMRGKHVGWTHVTWVRGHATSIPGLRRTQLWWGPIHIAVHKF